MPHHHVHFLVESSATANMHKLNHRPPQPVTHPLPTQTSTFIGALSPPVILLNPAPSATPHPPNRILSFFPWLIELIPPWLVTSVPFGLVQSLMSRAPSWPSAILSLPLHPSRGEGRKRDKVPARMNAGTMIQRWCSGLSTNQIISWQNRLLKTPHICMYNYIVPPS